jgi:hypothetical protein
MLYGSQLVTLVINLFAEWGSFTIYRYTLALARRMNPRPHDRSGSLIDMRKDLYYYQRQRNKLPARRCRRRRRRRRRRCRRRRRRRRRR